MKNDTIQTLRSALLSGIAVGIAGWGYLATMNIIGGVLFSFGLLTVVNYKLKLYTGSAGFVDVRNDQGEFVLPRSLKVLLEILLGNILGCLLVAMLCRLSPMDLGASAQQILQLRLDVGPLRGGALAIGCGFIMTTAVTFARQGKVLPMLFGVPLFITCGFPHCVADAFYYLATPLEFWSENWQSIAIFYLSIVLGNFIGCNFYRIVMGSNPEN